MASYSWLDFISARQQLAQRLYDPGMVWTTDAELGVYIKQALRMFNALTNTWKIDYVFNAPVVIGGGFGDGGFGDGGFGGGGGTPAPVWHSLGSLALPDSPRLRTLTDVDCYTQMEYMLLEPPTGGTWTGTPQFDISNFAQAVQKRRDEIMMVTNCNQQLLPNLPITPNTARTALPDNVIDTARVRYMPVQDPYGGYGMGYYGGGPYGGGFVPGVSGFTLYRDDSVALEFYEPPLYQLQAFVPQTFMLSSQPPLSFDVDVPPSLPGTYEAVVLQAGDRFNPPNNTLLNIPDDFAWVAIWGALSDLLGRESEATDRERADYCIKRYIDGLMLLTRTPWIMLAKINGVAVNVESIANMDRYSPEWDSDPLNVPCIVSGGIDFFAGPVGGSIGLTVLANAPVPVADGDFVQVSRQNWDTVLDLAQVWACFKMGGADFQSVLEIEARAVQACAAENSRLKSTGAFADILMDRSRLQDHDQERYASGASGQGAEPARQAGGALGLDRLNSNRGQNVGT